jgi:hypothetical protein
MSLKRQRNRCSLKVVTLGCPEACWAGAWGGGRNVPGLPGTNRLPAARDIFSKFQLGVSFRTDCNSLEPGHCSLDGSPVGVSLHRLSCSLHYSPVLQSLQTHGIQMAMPGLLHMPPGGRDFPLEHSCTALHCTALHCTALHCTVLQERRPDPMESHASDNPSPGPRPQLHLH